MKTLAERRIEIVKDAIAQLIAGTFKTGRYGYLKLSYELIELQRVNPQGSAQDALCNKMKVYSNQN